jgi:hypothetical protein
MIFETLDEYNKFHYGGVAGTSVSSAIYQTSAVFNFSQGANNSVAFNLPNIAYTELPLSPTPAATPSSSRFRHAQRGGSPVVTATVKNQVATY